MKFKFELEGADIIQPLRSTKGSAGYDIFSPHDIIIKPGEEVMIDSGVKIILNNNLVALMYPRSSLCLKRGLRLTNSVGVIDSDFRQSIKIPLYNFSGKEVEIKKGEKLVQIVVTEFVTADDEDENELGERTGGIGSTGL